MFQPIKKKKLVFLKNKKLIKIVKLKKKQGGKIVIFLKKVQLIMNQVLKNKKDQKEKKFQT